MNSLFVSGNYELLKLSDLIHGEDFTTDIYVRGVSAKILDCNDLWYMTNVHIADSNINTIFFTKNINKLTLKNTTYVSIVASKHSKIKNKHGKTIVSHKNINRVDKIPSVSVHSVHSLPETLIKRLLVHTLINGQEEEIPYIFGWLDDSNLLHYQEYDRPYINPELYSVDEETANVLREMIEIIENS